MTDFAFLSAGELAAGYRAGSFGPVDVVRALTERVNRLDPQLNAMISFDARSAEDAARQAERELANGLDRGPLHGVPVAIKDMIDIAGSPTSCASAAMSTHIAQRDAAVVTRLREAGAILFGKTNTHEFACGGPSFDLHFPPARNPWNTDHHPGGSSSGSGAGVAAGLFPLALGTDTGGSVRHPASACGIVGLKPTYGLISRQGVFPLAPSLDCVGVLARTVADAGALLDACIGRDPDDPASLPAPWKTCLPETGGGLAGVRIGYIRHFHETDIVSPPETAAALDGAALALAKAGATVEEIRLSPLGEFFAVNRVLLSAEAFSIHAEILRTRPQDYGSLARRALLAGAFLTSEDYIRAQKLRMKLIEDVQAAFGKVDIMLLASSMEPASRLDEPDETRRTYTRQARTPMSVTGHPAIAMMAGLSASGLPLSLQFSARSFEEPLLLKVAAAFEAMTLSPSRPPQFDIA
jgi:aspartyl-tRNA(Asn)/glutamyl-tRNA(Gln) amidotransferase subunit A